MNWKVFLLSVADYAVFMLYRDVFDAMLFSEYYFRPEWVVTMVLLMILNVIILRRIRPNVQKLFNLSIISGLITGIVFGSVFAEIIQAFAIKLFTKQIFYVSLYMSNFMVHKEINSDTAKYLIMIAAHIYAYNIICNIINKIYKEQINKLIVVIHNSGEKPVTDLEICFGQNAYQYDIIDKIEPNEYIKKVVLYEDREFLNKIQYPYDMKLKHKDQEFKIEEVFDRRKKVMVVDIENKYSGITVKLNNSNEKAEKIAVKKNTYKWNDM